MKIGVIVDPHVCERSPRCRKDNYFETVISKLDYVGSHCDKVIIGGDLFHVFNNSTFLFNRMYALFSKHKNKFIVIPGNHDICYNNYASLDKTTLGSLYYTGAVDLKTESFTLDGQRFDVSLCIKDMDKIPVDTNNENILIGHNFYDMDLSPKESFTREDIKKLNYKIIFLGHDHKPYEEDFVGNSILIRMGSLTRIDVQEYNRDREICYYEYDTKEKEYCRKVIPHKKIEDVYIDEAFKKVSKKSGNFSFTDIGNVLAKFKKQSEGAISLHKTLCRLKTPEKSVDFIKHIHKMTNVTYN